MKHSGLLLVHQPKHKSASDLAQLFPKYFDLLDLVGHQKLGPQALMLWGLRDRFDIKASDNLFECLHYINSCLALSDDDRR